MRNTLNTTIPKIEGAVGARAPIGTQRPANSVSPLVCEIQIAGAPHAVSLELPSAAPGGQNVVVQLTIGGEASSATAASSIAHAAAISAPASSSIPIDPAVSHTQELPASAPIGLDSFADTLASHGEPSTPIASIPTLPDVPFSVSHPSRAEVLPRREDLDQRLPRITAEDIELFELEASQATESHPSDTHESIFELEPIDAHQEMLAGFREADRKRSRQMRRLRVASVSALATLGFCLCAAGFTGIFFEEGLPIGATLASPSEQASPAEGEQSGEGEPAAAASKDASNGSDSNASDADASSVQSSDKAGTVGYSYATTAAEGGQVRVFETVTFDADGFAKTSHMSLSFESDEAAQAFMSRVSRDYGEAYLGGTIEGAAVDVRIDVSENRLDRNAYKRALSSTAQGLAVSSVSDAGSSGAASSGEGSSSGGSSGETPSGATPSDSSDG